MVPDLARRRVVFTQGDTPRGYHSVRAWHIDEKRIATIAGNPFKEGCADGTCASAMFRGPTGIAVDPVDGALIVVDCGNHRIVRIDEKADTVRTVAGTVQAAESQRVAFKDGAGDDARFSFPTGIVCDSTGSFYVADSDNRRIRKCTRSVVSGRVVFTVTTVAGNGEYGHTSGPLLKSAIRGPQALAFDPRDESVLY
jgi:sugar lactone lactonase YvrE